jgi:hypothetical protein
VNIALTLRPGACMMEALRSKYVRNNPRCVSERGDEESQMGLAFLINLAGVRPRQVKDLERET